MKKIIGVFVAAVLFLSPVANAQTTESLLQQISELLKIVTALQEQLATLTGTPTPSTSSGQASPTSYCAPQGTKFGIGTQNNEVTKLQTFLRNTGDFSYPEITGYYGSVTAKAIQKYQCREMQICSGSMFSNGYGLAGPSTRRNMCSTPTTNTTTYKQPPTTHTDTTTTGGGSSSSSNTSNTSNTTSSNDSSSTQPSTTNTTTDSTTTTDTSQQATYSSCTFNGQAVAHGDSVTAYLSSLVSCGQTCVSETRMCSDGVLGGSYIYDSCSQMAPTSISSTLGGYHWGGLVGAGSTLADGVGKLANAGLGKVTRVVLTPRFRAGGTDNVYNFDLEKLAAQCPDSEPFLPCMARTSYYQDLFNLPGLSTIVLSSYDSVTSGANGYGTDYVDPTTLSSSQKKAQVVAEYRDMTLALYETQKGTGKKFIITQWESDNSIYCGAAYSYVTDVAFRASCDAQTPTPTQRLEGMKTWFQLRQQGISEGRALAAQNGWGGVTVEDGIQFNSYQFIKDAGYKSTLYDIIPIVRPAYADYSAWESSEGGTLDRDLAAIKTYLAPYGSELVIGELGLKYMNASSISAWRWLETVKAGLRAQLEHIILWEAFPSTALDDAIFTAGGSSENSLNSLRSYLLSSPSFSQSSIQIGAVADRGVTQSKRYFELYGIFPGSGFSASVVCDSASVPTTIEYESAGQINISISDSTSAGQWCIFTVSSSSGISQTFGPQPLK